MCVYLLKGGGGGGAGRGARERETDLRERERARERCVKELHPPHPHPPPPPTPPCICERVGQSAVCFIHTHTHTHTHTERISTLGSNGYCKPKAIRFVYVGHAQPDWSGSCEKLKGGGRLQQAREVGPAMEQRQSGGGEERAGGRGRRVARAGFPFPHLRAEKATIGAIQHCIKRQAVCLSILAPPPLSFPSLHPPTYPHL